MKMLKPLSMQFITDFSKQYGIEPALILAIGKKESNLNNYDKNGLLIKRFEPHIYRGFLLVKKGRLLKHPVLPGIMPEWIKQHNEDELRLLSTSWGIFQIMGYYYPEMGYKTIIDLVEDWNVEEICIKKSLEFIVKYRGGNFLKALQNNDYINIARMWNGLGYARNNYDKDLERYHKEIQQVIKSVN